MDKVTDIVNDKQVELAWGMEELQLFLTDDQILEVAEFACNGRTLEATRLLQYFFMDKWPISTFYAANIVRKIGVEFSA